jgi:hypothetical protein
VWLNKIIATRPACWILLVIIILHTQGNLITEIYDDDDDDGVQSSKLLLQGMKSTRPCIHLESDRYIAILKKSYIKFKVNSRCCELLVQWHLGGD